MLVMRVRECSTRHQVLREVLGYQASTVRKLLIDAGQTQIHRYTDTHTHKQYSVRQCNKLSFYSSTSQVQYVRKECVGES